MYENTDIYVLFSCYVFVSVWVHSLYVCVRICDPKAPVYHLVIIQPSAKNKTNKNKLEKEQKNKKKLGYINKEWCLSRSPLSK